MKILQRYIVREHIGPLAFALAALTSLLLLNQVAKQFGNLVGKGLAWSVIGEFFMLSIPFIVAMTLPMAVLVSTLYAFSRLAAENEITALKASGVGLWRIIRPVLWGSAAIAVLMVAFNDQVLPRSNHRLRTLQSDIGRTKPTFALKEQVINEVSPGRLYLRAGHIDEASNRMREITIYDLSDAARRRTVHADSGLMALAANQTDLELTLHDGFSQEVPRDNATELQRLYFVTDVVRVRGVANSFDRTTEDTYKSDREMSICEMQEVVSLARRNQRIAREELEESLAAAAWKAATGVSRPQQKPDSALAVRSIGAAYCRWVLPLFGVKSAEAAPPPQGATRQPPGQEAVRRAVQQAAQRADSAGRRAPRPATPARPAASLPPALRNRYPQERELTPRETARREALERARAESLAAAGSPAVPRPGTAFRKRPPGAIETPVPEPMERHRPTFDELSAGAVRAQIDAFGTRLEQASEDASQYEVEIQKKFALAAACVVFVLLGAPIALRFPRGGVGLVIGVSLGVFALYYVGLIGGETLADKLILSPFWAMWLPNLIFTLTGIFFLHRVRTSGSTARGGDFGEMLDAAKTGLGGLLRGAGLPFGERRRKVAT
jgi:lipopolysaccharide export system permease protein